MGCGGSKPEDPGDAVKTEEIDMKMTAKEKRMSVTKRRVAIRCARERGRPAWAAASVAAGTPRCAPQRER